MAFLDELARLNQIGFLGGLAKYGAAIKDAKDNEFIYNTYEKFKQDKAKLLSTDEQIDELNKIVSTHDKKQEGDVSPEVNVAFNLLKAYERLQLTSDLYTPYIMAFASLGTKEGTDIANMLTKELANQIGIIEKRADIPFKAMDYERSKAILEKDKFELQKLQSDFNLSKDSNEIADWLMLSGTLEKYLSAYKVGIGDGNLLKVFVDEGLLKVLMELTAKQFPEASKGAITNGLYLAMTRTGRTLEYKNVSKIVKDMENGGSWAGYTATELMTYASFCRGWTSEWNNMSEDVRNKLIKHMSGEEIISSDDPEYEWYQEKANIFKPNGLYQQYHDALASVPGGNFMKKKTITIKTDGGIGKEFEVPADDGVIGQLLGSTQDIIRMYGTDSFIKRRYDYNGYNISRFKEALGEKRRKEIGSIFNKVEGEKKPYMDEYESLRFFAPKTLPEDAFLEKKPFNVDEFLIPYSPSSSIKPSTPTIKSK